MNAQDLQARLKKFAISSVFLFKSLPREEEAKIIGKQFLRSALSSAANYRAACKAQTKKSFVAKLSIAFEESDEAVFWLELMQDAGIVSIEKISAILPEAKELAAILAASRKTAASQSKS